MGDGDELAIAVSHAKDLFTAWYQQMCVPVLRVVGGVGECVSPEPAASYHESPLVVRDGSEREAGKRRNQLPIRAVGGHHNCAGCTNSDKLAVAEGDTR